MSELKRSHVASTDGMGYLVCRTCDSEPWPCRPAHDALEARATALATENQTMREALRACLRGDLTLVMDGPTPGIGFDYSYVPATKEVMATLAEVNRLAALAPDTEEGSP